MRVHFQKGRSHMSILTNGWTWCWSDSRNAPDYFRLSVARQRPSRGRHYARRHHQVRETAANRAFCGPADIGLSTDLKKCSKSRCRVGRCRPPSCVVSAGGRRRGDGGAGADLRRVGVDARPCRADPWVGDSMCDGHRVLSDHCAHHLPRGASRHSVPLLLAIADDALGSS